MCEYCESNDRQRTSPSRSRCDKCACNILNRLQRGTEVDVFLSGGTVLEDVIFLRFNNRTCCATFRDEEEEPNTTLFVDCRDIVALRIE
jgi:hypothetical protein